MFATPDSDSEGSLSPAVAPVATVHAADPRTLASHERIWRHLLASSRKARRMPAQQRTAIEHHLAVLSAEMVQKAPGLRAWCRGFRHMSALKAQSEDKFFDRKAPARAECHGQHSVLDLGLQVPAGQSTLPPMGNMARVLAYFARFQLAAYGASMYWVVNPFSSCFKPPCCFLSHESAFTRFVGIPERDLSIRYSFTDGGPFQPVHWLCIDRVSRAVVITIRGTWSLSDCITDAFARQTHYGDYVVHSGLLHAAEWVLRKVRRHLSRMEVLAGDSPFQLVVVGHSLGGAVAAMLAKMLRDRHCPRIADGRSGESPRTYYAYAFCYGAPMLFDRRLATEMERFVINVVNNKDVFPRVSHHSLENLCNHMAHFGGEQRNEPDEPEHDLEVFHDAVDDIAHLPTIPMFNPGWQLYLQRRSLGPRCCEMLPVLRRGMLWRFLLHARTPARDGDELEIWPAMTMWPDHFPQSYLYVCEEYAERLNRQQGSTGTGAGGTVDVALRRLTAYWNP
mmetsp:Transcript_104762/g.291759  ORF Transcript_104762/g.291759 Transcript_104762/m.291759 type:complete len:507 (+) Transcript_104762:89-1609(+)